MMMSSLTAKMTKSGTDSMTLLISREETHQANRRESPKAVNFFSMSVVELQ